MNESHGQIYFMRCLIELGVLLKVFIYIVDFKHEKQSNDGFSHGCNNSLFYQNPRLCRGLKCLLGGPFGPNGESK